MTQMGEWIKCHGTFNTYAIMSDLLGNVASLDILIHVHWGINNNSYNSYVYIKNKSTYNI